jgi:serine/threonine protein kinase
MEHLMSKRFVHRDLAARNVLLASGKSSTGMVCKVADFGLSRGGAAAGDDAGEGGGGENYYRSQQGVFPVRWTSPEAMETLKFSEASDIWSYGIVLIEILTDGEKPFPDIKSNPGVVRFTLGGGKHPKPPACDTSATLSELYDLACICFKTDPNERPPFTFLAARADKLAVDHHGDDDVESNGSAASAVHYEFVGSCGADGNGEIADELALGEFYETPNALITAARANTSWSEASTPEPVVSDSVGSASAGQSCLQLDASALGGGAQQDSLQVKICEGFGDVDAMEL